MSMSREENDILVQWEDPNTKTVQTEVMKRSALDNFVLSRFRDGVDLKTMNYWANKNSVQICVQAAPIGALTAR